MACSRPDLELEPHGSREWPFDVEQLYAAYAAAHLSVGWAELVLDHVVARRDELLDRYAVCVDADERTSRLIEWLRNLPDNSFDP